ncbi:NAD(P)H-quinone oxidoreductase subunit F [Nodosilinea sp. LEGE 07088]|uniref:NAD(P)H-quinone oxidoreductase subunit F n=1 Tax=Nodosilinea sp. LEGE 07088 TaxID=2777968 RepID=UPI0018826531|nr:NAD(P)H-quinone oxidoreductase subunit F [Nodosilinea sp. LEGE 07088]MBE9138001.1 NAD(P)H-quinone oxidoreductase subunit F [Nodosilinea sp. LEGE 07088]
MAQFFVETSWLLPIYGLIGALLALPWSTGMIRRTGPRPAVYLNILMTLVAFGHGVMAFRGIWNSGPQELLFSWFEVADVHLTLAFDISVLNLGALELITGLSLLAQVFALGYLEKDWALARFYSLMGFFEAAMSGLVLSGSLFVSYSLLEMLTLSTYLLVGFWFAQPLVVTAARDAFLTKRIGDVLLLMGVVTLASLAGSLNFNDLYEWVKVENLSPTMATLLGLALIAGPIGKCAQFPLHLWLDEAMEGPNPASILRNSVVVTCGAFVLIRLQPIVVLSPVALGTLVGLGTVTAVGASLVALAQIDIKRTFSYSTSAYLGLVFIAIGTEWPGVALMLLLTHAVAKALIFMAVGSIITTTSCQDMTELGGLGRKMPATTFAYVTGALGMVGVMPLGCFWGLRMGADFLGGSAPLLALLFFIVNGLTALNLTRVFRQVFLGTSQPKTRRAPEVPWQMAVPMVTLSIINLLVPLAMGKLSLLPPWEYINWPITVLMLVSGWVGVAIGATVPLSKSLARSLNRTLRIAQDLLAYDFYTERLYDKTVVLAVSSLARFSSWFDQYVVDGLVNGVGLASLFGGESLKYSASGQSQLYLLTIVAGVGLLGIFMTWTLW